MRPPSAPPHPDVAIARLAGDQYGVVTTAQIQAVGLDSAALARRLRLGRLHRIHHGVYAVGHAALERNGRYMAAVLACGRTAALSHRSAAELIGLLDPIGVVVHVTIPGRAGRARRPGIRIHRPRKFDGSLTTVRNRIPVTTVERTLFDLRRTTPGPTYRRALRQAEIRGMQTGVPPERTRSDLERAFLLLCRKHGLPEPEVNSRIGRLTVDFYWPRAGLVIEVDGYGYHRGREAFRVDRDRDLELGARGLAIHRIADSRLTEDPAGVAALVRQLLIRPRRGG